MGVLKMSDQLDIAYIAGLFDGEGCITYKQYMRKRKGQKKAYKKL
jgi:intein/homing endonuclease